MDHHTDLESAGPTEAEPVHDAPPGPGTSPLGPAPPDRQKRPHHDSICASIRDRIAALPAGSVVLAEDETHLDLLARVRSCWMPTGLRHQILTPGTNVRRTVHGAVNLLTGAIHHHVSVKNVSVVFC